MIDGAQSGYAGILSREEAAKRCTVERLRGGTIVFTNGVFDLLHAGHVQYLEAARALGTTLLVGLNSDESARRIKGPRRPLVGELDRAVTLCALRAVDHVILFDEDTPEALIRLLSPHVLVKGGDYRIEDIVGYDQVTAAGGRVVTIPLREGCSTSSIIELIRKRYR
ncbi:D-glycero-beta-D-manno-heptose 1-phosphate adenylyltransferase [candidate division KSB1 bacterium]|nr:D-glycero-beta-D-manno-heptose 1-phosphate adenylyltransferase [candidate division KSB1 bacterium]